MTRHFEDEASKLTLRNAGFELPLRTNLAHVLGDVVDIYAGNGIEKRAAMNRVLAKALKIGDITQTEVVTIRIIKDYLLFSTSGDTYVHPGVPSERLFYSD